VEQEEHLEELGEQGDHQVELVDLEEQG